MPQTHYSAENPESKASKAHRTEQPRSRQGGRQHGEHADESRPDNSYGKQHWRAATALSVPVIAMRGVAQLYDMQSSVARMVLQTQADAACAIGLPDYSGLFRTVDGRTKRIFSTSTDQFLQLAEQIKETISEVQQHISSMLEVSFVNAAENWQRGLNELGSQAEEGLEQLKETARQQAQEAMEATDFIGRETREAMREGSEETGQSLRQSFEQGRGAAHGNGETSSAPKRRAA